MPTTTLDPISVGLIILSIALLVTLGFVIHMYMRLKKFLIGINSDHVGDSLTHISKSLDDLHKFRADLDIYLDTVENRLKRSLRSVHTVRFNPFKGDGSGGNQSFSTAFLNEEGDGVIISSLYSREHVSVFSKPVKKHASEFELSDEENESLDAAKKGLKS
jgi:hypothetical protein